MILGEDDEDEEGEEEAEADGERRLGEESKSTKSTNLSKVQQHYLAKNEMNLDLKRLTNENPAL